MAACEQTPAGAHYLGDEEFVVVMGAGHRQLAADRGELRDLAGEPWVRFDRDSALDGVLLDAGQRSEPVIGVVRADAGAAETALLEISRKEGWSVSAALVSPVSWRTRRGRRAPIGISYGAGGPRHPACQPPAGEGTVTGVG